MLCTDRVVASAKNNTQRQQQQRINKRGFVSYLYIVEGKENIRKRPHTIFWAMTTITDSLNVYNSIRPLRSLDANRLVELRITSKCGDDAFSYCSHALCNKPLQIWSVCVCERVRGVCVYHCYIFCYLRGSLIMLIFLGCNCCMVCLWLICIVGEWLYFFLVVCFLSSAFYLRFY